MNIIDIILLLTVAVPGVYVGLKKGFIGQLAAVLALTLGIWLSFHFASALGQWLGKYVELEKSILEIVAFLLIFIGIFFACEGLGKQLGKIISSVVGGWIDNVLGIVLGIFKYSLIAGLAIMLFDSINGNFHFVKQETLDSSVFYAYMEWLIHTLFPYLKSLLNG